MGTNSEKTVTVLELEQFKLLPKNTQKLINKLSNDLKIDGLNIFNPLVEAMVTIEGFRKIKYSEENEDCIKQYKEAKSFVRSFRASTKNAKKELKAPLIATGKDLDAIERTFIESATDVLDNYLENEFKPYLDEEARKKQEALDRKNADAIQKIKDLSEAKVEQTLIIERSNLYNKINSSIQFVLNEMFQKVENYSKEALETELVSVKEMSFVLSDSDKNILLDDQVEELAKQHENIRLSCIRMLSGRINEFELEEFKKKKEEALAIEAEKLKIAQETPEVKPFEMTAPVMSTDKENVMGFSEYFGYRMDELIGFIKVFECVSEKEANAQKSAINGLENYKNKIQTYLK